MMNIILDCLAFISGYFFGWSVLRTINEPKKLNENEYTLETINEIQRYEEKKTLWIYGILGFLLITEVILSLVGGE